VIDVKVPAAGPQFSGSAREGTSGVEPLSAAKLTVQPIEADFSIRNRAYLTLRRAITEMDIYGDAAPLRLDERQLSQDLGVSRTPIREAMNRLEQEGLIRSVPRRGMFVVRKTKAEILEMITVWAALERDRKSVV
jgi:DNA-binding GntR family transcriptional regulator